MYRLIIIAMMLLLIANHCEADSFNRCGNSFVHRGDSVEQVYSKCGKPDFIHESSGGGAVKKVETWNYKNKTFRIKNGLIKDIESRLPKPKKRWSYSGRY